ncbi:glycoside hydrolase family 2 TIM barrel-domain containing protein [Plantibacter flavus]|uniref:glycoside hydrolase family 2 TIM barrel-domain containing protein n=1 Tax=Plantibacter flavus TaxID=150123 RepID=UPI003F5CD148
MPEVRITDVVTVAEWDHARGLGSLRVDVQTDGLAHRTDGGYRTVVRIGDDEHDGVVSPRVAAPTLPKPARGRNERPVQTLPDDFMDLLSIRAASAPIPPEFRAIPDLATMTMPTFGIAGTAVVERADLAVRPWSPETPELYDLSVSLIDPTGTEIDRVGLRVGFRTVRIVGTDLLINGRRVLFQGVNRHDIDHRTGRVVSRDRMLRELSLLKRCNVNAIRASHYPNDPHFLDLCDEIGFLVVDEADVESHAFASSLAHDPRYLLPIMERVSRMVLRDRNHPCVVSWSLGNESGHAPVHEAAAAWVRATDPTRPVQYEGAVGTDWHAGHASTDLVVPMYPSFAALEGYAMDERTDRPLITCEYAYSQGNSTGGLAEYWRLFESLPALQGGFIWEFTDHALDVDGDGRLRYGGDFDDAGQSGATMLNGIAFSDAAPKPAMFEMRGIFSPIRITSGPEDVMQGRLRVRSRRAFSGLDDLELSVRVDTRRGAGQETPIKLDLAPGSERSIDLPVEIVQHLTDPGVLAVTLTARTATSTIWAPAGTEVAVQQVVLPRAPLSLPIGGPARVAADGSIRHPLLTSPPRLSLWRALTDNDASFALDKRFVRSGFFALTPSTVDAEAEGDATVVTIRYATAWGEEIVHRRRISAADGEYRFDEDVSLPHGTRDGLRVGVEFELSDGFTDAAWTGLGPWENYPDRSDSALLGRWTSPVDDLATPYLIPQENGTRGGVDELELFGSAGRVRVQSATTLHVNVSRYTTEELEEATHWWKLPASSRTIVHLDIAHRGVGTALLGPDTRPVHRLNGDHYAWSWSLALAPEN